MENHFFFWIFMSDRIGKNFVLCTVSQLVCVLLFSLLSSYSFRENPLIENWITNCRVASKRDENMNCESAETTKKSTWISQLWMFRYIFFLSFFPRKDPRSQGIVKWISLFLMFSWKNAKKSLFFLLLSQYRRSFLWHYTRINSNFWNTNLISHFWSGIPEESARELAAL